MNICSSDHEAGRRREDDICGGAGAVRQGGRDVHHGAHHAGLDPHRGQQAADTPGSEEFLFNMSNGQKINMIFLTEKRHRDGDHQVRPVRLSHRYRATRQYRQNR